MRRLMHVSVISSRWVVSALALLGSLSATSQAAQAPPSVPTGFQLGLTHEPNVVLTSDAMVYAASDPTVAYTGDLFRYGQYWFAHEGDHWYRSLGWDGEFKPIEKSRVPRAVIVVPKRFWKGYRGADAMAPTASRPTAAVAVPAPAKKHPVSARSATSGGTIRVASAQPRIVAVSHPVAASSPPSHSPSAHGVAASTTNTARKTAVSKKASPKSNPPVPASSANVAKASIEAPKHLASATTHGRTTKSSEGPVASRAAVPVKLDAKAEKKIEHEQDKLMKERLKEARKQAEQAEKLAHAKPHDTKKNTAAKSGEPDSGSIAKAASKRTGATATRSAKPAAKPAKPAVTTVQKTAAKTSKAASSKKADENLTASR